MKTTKMKKYLKVQNKTILTNGTYNLIEKHRRINGSRVLRKVTGSKYIRSQIHNVNRDPEEEDVRYYMETTSEKTNKINRFQGNANAEPQRILLFSEKPQLEYKKMLVSISLTNIYTRLNTKVTSSGRYNQAYVEKENMIKGCHAAIKAITLENNPLEKFKELHDELVLALRRPVKGNRLMHDRNSDTQSYKLYKKIL